MFTKKPKTVSDILAVFDDMKTDLGIIVQKQMAEEEAIGDQILALDKLKDAAILERQRAATAIENISKLVG